MTDEKKAVSIMVPSKDPKKDDKDKDGDKDKDKEVTTLDGVGGAAGDADKTKKKKKTKGGKDILEPEELSEEDKALKEGLELAVTRVDDSEPGIGEVLLFYVRTSALYVKNLLYIYAVTLPRPFPNCWHKISTTSAQNQFCLLVIFG